MQPVTIPMMAPVDKPVYMYVDISISYIVIKLEVASNCTYIYIITLLVVYE